MKLLDTAAQLPRRSYDDDIGLDLFTSYEAVIPGNGFKGVPCGIAVELPPLTWGLLLGRSSTATGWGLFVLPGVLDPGYRGELSAMIYNLRGQTQTIPIGTKIAQLIITLHPGPVDVERVAELGESSRGVRGFGSTGA